MPANEVGKFQPGQWRTDIEEWPVTASRVEEEKASEMLQTGFSGRSSTRPVSRSGSGGGEVRSLAH